MAKDKGQEDKGNAKLNRKEYEKELRRLVEVEGFTAHVGGTPSEEHAFRGRRWGGVAAVRRACEAVPDDAWGWFQLYYAIPEKELNAMDGSEIVAAILAISAAACCFAISH